MAMTGESRSAAAQSVAPRATPGWVVPLYLAGLVLVYLGERVLATWGGHMALTGAGVLAVVIATALRFAPRFRSGGERRGIENLLAMVSVAGLVALGVYALTTDWGLGVLGLRGADSETRDRASGILTIVWVSLVLCSVLPMIFAETALHPMRRALLPEGRRVRSAAANGLILALAAIYGSLFVYAAHGVEAAADFSYFKTSKPSTSTRRIAESLTEPVTVIAFFPDVNEVKSEVERYLRELTSGLTTIKVEIKDHFLMPKLARELRVTQDGAIVLKRGSSSETLILGTEMDSARAKLKTLDQDFQERLMKLARAKRTAYLTSGHGELNESRPGAEETGRSAKLLRQLLQRQNYLVKDLGLGQGFGTDVPEDAAIVLVLGPTEPFAPEEISSLQRYADRGGHLLIALDPDPISEKNLATEELAAQGDGNPAAGATPASATAAARASAGADAGATTPAVATQPAPADPASARVNETLDAIVNLVGLKRLPGTLTNEREHLRRRFNDSDRVLLITNTFSSHASVSTLSRNSSRAAIVTFAGGALDSQQGTAAKVDFAIRSRTNSFLDLNRNYTLDGDEKRGVHNVAAAVTLPKKNGAAAAPPKDDKGKDDKGKSKDDKPTPEEMRAFVIADADAFSDMVLSNVGTNQLLFVDAVRWLGGEESFAGQATSEEDVRIEHTKEKDLVWFYATIFGAPAVVLGAGVLFSRRSRRSRPRGGRS